MGNRLKKLIMFLVVVLGMTLFANEEQKAPNEIIKDNPEREVTTVESMKVRDHATMSLSVTKKNVKEIEGELVGDRLMVQLPVKGISENTLDRMAKPKEGKRLVVESKSKINPRMVRMATKDIKKMPTQEEMNNLTVEQIQAMMSDTTDKKEEESQSKNIKNHIATENEEGVNLDILGVNKNEDIYVNVEENGQVVDRYRVAIANIATPRNSIESGNMSGYLTGQIVAVTGNSVWLIDKTRGKNANITKLQSVIYEGGNLYDYLTFTDPYFGERRINLDLSRADGAMGASFRLERPSNLNLTPMPKSGTVGSKNESYESMEKTAQTGLNYGSSNYPGLYYALDDNNWAKQINGFKKLYLEEVDLTNGNNTKTDYLTATVSKVGFELAPYIKGSIPCPGVYQTLGSVQAKYSGVGFSNLSVSANYIKVDVGDIQIAHGSQIDENNKKKYTRNNLDTVTDSFIELPEQTSTIQISYMNNNSELGLFYHDKINNQFIKLSPGVEQEIIYNQSNGSGQNVEQRIKIKITQQSQQWAKVSYKVVSLKNPNATGNPQVVFEIVQGRKYGTNGNKITSLSELRRAKYTLNFNRVIETEPKKDINIQLDPRIKNNLTSDGPGTYSWITLDKRFGKWDHNNKTLLEGTIYVDGVYQDDTVTVTSVEKVDGKTKSTSDGYDKFKVSSGARDEIVFKQNVTFTQLSSNSNLMIEPVADTYNITYNGSDSKKYTSTITVTSVAEPSDSWYKSDKGYTGNGIINLSGKDKVGQTYALANQSVSISGNELYLNTHNGFLPIFAGLVQGKTTTEIVTSYKVTITGENNSQTIEFGTSNNGVTTADGALKVQLVKTNDVNNKKNIKVTKLKDDDFTKNIKFEYYSGVVKLGEYDLTVTNTKTVDLIGTLTTTIDPRLAKLTTEEWITLGNFSGGTDLADLTANKYSGLIKATTNQLDPQKTIKEIIKVSKGGTTYSYLKPDNASYKRYGTGNSPSIAILKTLQDPNIAYTNVLQNNANLARKVKDKDEIKVEFKAGDDYYYSFNHNLAVEPNPTTNSEEFTAEKGYIGETSVNLTGKEIDKTYTLNRNGASGNYEINISGATTSGWMPTLHGLFDKTQNIADYYKINSGSEIKFGNANNGVDITENGTTLFNIKLIKSTDTQDKKNVQIIKKKDIDFSKTVKIEYYHSSGIKLGEFTVNVSNTKTVTSIGSMSNNLDSRLTQKSNEWISLAGYGHENIGQLEENRYLEFIGATSSNISETNKQKTIISINEVKKENTKYVEISNSSDNKTYARYGTTTSTPLLGIKKKNSTSTDNNNIETNISELTGTDFFARKISDTGSISVEFVATNKNNYSFTHNLVSVSDTSGEPGKFTAERGYIGSANVDLSGKDIETEYTLIRNNETVVGNQIKISGQVGWLPTFGGVVSDYRDTVIVDHYKINNSNPIYFTSNNGHDFGNFNIKLIKPDTVSDKKNIIITKKNDNTYNQNVLIEYYHSSGIKLGEFTLTVTNTRTEKDLGESTVKIDSRIAQVSDAYSWIDLKNGDMFQLSSGTKAGNYTDFIGVPTAFPNATTLSSYNEFNLEKVLEINDSTSIVEDAYTYSGANYTITQNNDEAGIPTGIKLKDFIKVDNSSKLIISKWDVTDSEHTKNNKFLISGKNGNKVAVFKGNIKEIYLDKNGGEITSSTIDKTQNIFSGSGTLNLAPATAGTSYWFAKTGSGELKGNGNSNEIILKLGLNSDPLNAAGIIPKSNSKRVANKMVLTMSGKEETVNLNGENLEKELSIGEGKVKIAIDNTGRLVVTKTQEGNIPSTPIEIKYYYKSSTNISNSEIHLGTFTLTIENPVVEIGTRNVKIDKRFVDKDGYNWLLGNNTAKGTINGNTTSNSFTSLFKYEGNFKNLATDTIERAIKIEDRPVRGNASSSAEYLNFIVGTGVYQDEAAVLNKGTINELTNKVIVSKYNGADSSLTNNGLLNNKFYILAKDSNDKYKIYTGNVTEEIVGNGVISGTGSVIFRAINNGKTYTFNPGVGGSATATTDNTTMTITVNQGGKLLDGRGQSNIQSGNIANKITVSKDGNVSSAGNSAIIDGITFGISSAGGLTISKSNSVSLTEDTIYTIKFYYSAESVDVELSTFNLTVKKTEAEDVGDIEFEVDPRLVKISSVDSGSVKWMSGDKMFGSWDTKEDYSNVIYTKNKITNVTTVDYVDTVVGKFRGTGTDYTVFKTAETGGYNIIAFKTGVALNNYLSEKNLMLSPADDQTFETIFEGTDGNKYKAEIILTHATGVSQEGYLGSGVLDISNGIKGTEYLFSAPTNTRTSIANGLSMTVTDDFPNTNGIVTGKKSTSIADSVVVTVNGAPVTPEIDSNVIGNQIYKVNNDLKVGLTSNNQIKIIKLSNEFDYKGTSAIEIKYKYKEVTLGSFTLDISSKEVEAGSITFDVDQRLEQLSQTLGTYVTGNKTLGNNNHGNHNKTFSELIKVTPSYLNGAGELTNITIDSVEDKEEIGNDIAIGYIGFGKTEAGPAEIILKRNSGRLDYYGGNTKDTLISILNSERYIAKVKANTGEIYSLDFVLARNENAPKDGYTGTGSLSLAPAVLDKEYKFDPGLIAETTKDEITLKITGADSRSIDTRGLINSTDSIANLMEITVNNTEDPIRVVGIVGQAFEKTKIPVGEAEITLGIETNGGFKIVKTKEGNINNVPVRVDYYYSTNANDKSAAKVKLGTFNLTIDNPVVNVGTRNVKIDKRFADASVETYSWLLGNNTAKVDVNGTSPVDFSSLFKYDSNAIFSNLTDDTIVKALRIDGRTDKVNQSGKYIAFEVTGSDRVNEAAVLNQGTIRNLNDEVIVSKNNGATSNLNNKFYILAEDTANRQTIYTGDVTEEIVGDGKTTGSGTLFFKAENDGNIYTFEPGATNTATGTSTDNRTQLVITVNTDGKLPDGTGYAEIKTGKIANKITVTKNPSAGQNSATSSRVTSESVTVDNITFGISPDGGLTISKASTASLAQDTTYTIKFYYSANSNAADDIELSTFDLTIKKTTAEKKGDITFNVDPRLTQITTIANGNVTWLNPNGMFGPWDNTSKKDYTKFLDLNNGVADNIQATIDSVVDREDGILSGGYIVFKNKKAEPYNDIAFKLDLNLSEYGSADNIMVSPYEATTFDSTFIDSDGNRYQVDVIVNHNSTVPKDGYSGSGTINMTSATLDTSYSFTAGGTGNVASEPSGVTLKVATDKKSLDATGVVTSTDVRIANFMTVQVGSATAQEISLAENKLETNILGDKIKVGINESGELTLTKLVEGNIDPTLVVINYYYKPSNGDAQSKVKLGEFTLTIENPMITSNTDVTVEIDKRFENVTGYNWLFRDGKVSSDITSGTPAKVSGFEDFFTFSGDLDSQNGAIVKDLGMTNREVKNAGIEADYGYYHLTDKTGTDAWRGEGAVPRRKDMSKLNDLITVSKGNDPNDLRSLENEFSLLFTDSTNGNRYSIYRGKIIEKIKGSGKYIGAGKIKEKDLTQNKKYIFSTKTNKMGTITSDNEDVSIVEASGMPVNALGVVSGKETEVVANKIRVEYKEENESGALIEQTAESTNETLGVTLNGLKVGIDTTGGLTLEKTQEKTNITEVVINYLYEVTIGSEKKTVDLGEFTLTIEKDTITIDPNDAFLDFGKMFYDSRDGGETHETRVKKFKVINEAEKEISFKVDKNTGEMTSNGNRLELRNISVEKDSNTGFTLQATAVLNKDTKPGSYEGTIEVIVDIITPSNP